jgi:hypothetical protein
MPDDKSGTIKPKDATIATQQQQLAQFQHVDLPEPAETFADSIRSVMWDGQTLRVELSVTRFSELSPATTSAQAKRYPACRLVMTAGAAVDLFNRLQQTMAALSKAGVVTQQKPPAIAEADAGPKTAR